MNETHQLDKLHAALTKAERVLVVGHQNCGDATGSVTALARVLTLKGKAVTPFLPSPVPKALQFLHGTENIVTDHREISWDNFDVLLCVDVAEPKMAGLGDKWETRPAEVLLINFDHHHTNPEYGELNIVDRTASATCAMLYEWFRKFNYPIDRQTATSLLTGILTDTGLFSNAGTNERALTAAADLLVQGASVSRVLEKIIKNRTIPELKLWGKAFERLHENKELGIISTVITLKDIEELGGTPEALEGVANFLNDIGGYKAVLVLKEQPGGVVKGSLRTTRDDVDVSAMAKLFGGGGHRKAAGFSVQGRLVETEKGWLIDKA